MYGELLLMTDWWHDPDPDGWTRGEWLAVLGLNALLLVVVAVVWVLESLFVRGE